MESVVYFICHNLRLYNVVENTGFRYMIHTMKPCYVIPTCKQITEVAVPRMYEEVKQIVKTSLCSAERVMVGHREPLSLVLRITSHHIDEETDFSRFADKGKCLRAILAVTSPSC